MPSPSLPAVGVTTSLHVGTCGAVLKFSLLSRVHRDAGNPFQQAAGASDEVSRVEAEPGEDGHMVLKTGCLPPSKSSELFTSSYQSKLGKWIWKEQMAPKEEVLSSPPMTIGQSSFPLACEPAQANELPHGRGFPDFAELVITCSLHTSCNEYQQVGLCCPPNSAQSTLNWSSRFSLSVGKQQADHCLHHFVSHRLGSFSMRMPCLSQTIV